MAWRSLVILVLWIFVRRSWCVNKDEQCPLVKMKEVTSELYKSISMSSTAPEQPDMENYNVENGFDNDNSTQLETKEILRDKKVNSTWVFVEFKKYMFFRDLYLQTKEDKHDKLNMITIYYAQNIPKKGNKGEMREFNNSLCSIGAKRCEAAPHDELYQGCRHLKQKTAIVKYLLIRKPASCPSAISFTNAFLSYYEAPEINTREDVLQLSCTVPNTKIQWRQKVAGQWKIINGATSKSLNLKEVGNYSVLFTDGNGIQSQIDKSIPSYVTPTTGAPEQAASSRNSAIIAVVLSVVLLLIIFLIILVIVVCARRKEDKEPEDPEMVYHKPKNDDEAESSPAEPQEDAGETAPEPAAGGDMEVQEDNDDGGENIVPKEDPADSTETADADS